MQNELLPYVWEKENILWTTHHDLTIQIANELLKIMKATPTLFLEKIQETGIIFMSILAVGLIFKKSKLPVMYFGAPPVKSD